MNAALPGFLPCHPWSLQIVETLCILTNLLCSGVIANQQQHPILFSYQAVSPSLDHTPAFVGHAFISVNKHAHLDILLRGILGPVPKITIHAAFASRSYNNPGIGRQEDVRVRRWGGCSMRCVWGSGCRPSSSSNSRWPGQTEMKPHFNWFIKYLSSAEYVTNIGKSQTCCHLKGTQKVIRDLGMAASSSLFTFDFCQVSPAN